MSRSRSRHLQGGAEEGRNLGFVGSAPRKRPLQTAIDVISLNDGNSIPVVGLGVYRMRPGSETYQSVQWALEAGYRMIDTAQMYRNEADVGRAIRESGIPREEVFVQSKLDTPNHGFDETKRAVERSLRKSGLKYFDCFVIHSPFGGKLVETWDALLSLQREGDIRSIGVSNFAVRHLEALRQAGRPVPAINQFEMHPLNYQERLNLIKYCQANGILVQAYASLFGGTKQALRDQRLLEVAGAHPEKTVQHVLLRWAIQKGFQVIPKSVRKDVIEDNLRLFDFKLSSSEMADLSNWKSADLGEYWNPVDDAPVDLGDVKTYRSQC